MPDLRIANPDGARAKNVGFDRVVQVQRGKEQEAIAAAKQNGADDVIFRTDKGDVFIASRTGLPGSVNELDKVTYGASVTYGEARGEVLSIDNERNTIGETAGSASKWGGLGFLAGAGAAVAGLLKFTSGSFGRTHWAVALGGGVLAGAAAFATSLFKGREKPDYDKLDRYAERIDV